MSAPAMRPGCDPATGAALVAWMQAQRFDAPAMAQRTGYALATVRCWMSGWSLTERARAALAFQGFARALEGPRAIALPVRGTGGTGRPRGFAAMSPEQQRAIASRGGKAAHALGTAHRWTSEEAAAAGRVGGAIVAQDRAHMRAIGTLGGRAKKGARRRPAQTAVRP